MEENPVQTSSKDKQFTISPVHTSAETATDRNFHKAEPVNGNTDRTGVNSNNEPTSENKAEKETTMTLTKCFRIATKLEENKWVLPDEMAAYTNRIFFEKKIIGRSTS